jgi:hypothetical protein
MLNYIHIPKCGGSTIRGYLRQRFSEKIRVTPNCYSVFVYGDKHKMGTFNISSEDINEGARLSSITSAKHVDASGHLLGVVGHLNYFQLTLFLNNINTYENTFSIVRDPLARAVSNLNYQKLRTNNLKKNSYALKINQDNLFEYLLSLARKNNANFQCNYLGASLTQDSKISEHDLKRLVFSKLHVYKLDNSVKAIDNHIFPVAQDFIVDKRNVTSENKDKSNTSDDVSLVSLDLMVSKELGVLKDAYRNDFLLFEMAS